jgi:WD40 repeat protein
LPGAATLPLAWKRLAMTNILFPCFARVLDGARRPRFYLPLLIGLGFYLVLSRCWPQPGPRQVLPGHDPKLSRFPNHIVDLVFSPDSRYIAVFSDVLLLGGWNSPHSGTIRIWDLEEQKVILSMRHCRDSHPLFGGNSMAFSPDATQFIVLGCEDISVWHLPTQCQLKQDRRQSHHWGWGAWQAIVPDGKGRLLVLDCNLNRYSWKDYESGCEVCSIPQSGLLPQSGQRSLFMAAPGVCLARRADNLEVWKLPEGQLRAEFPHDYTFDWAASSEGNIVAAMDWRYGGVQVWEQNSGRTWTYDHKACYHFTLSRDGTLFAGAHKNTTTESPGLWRKNLITLGDYVGLDMRPRSPSLGVYRLSDGGEVASFFGASWARFSPDGRMLAVVGEDGRIELYDIPLRPFWRIVAVSFGAFLFCFLVGRFLSWRRRRKGLMAAMTPAAG